MSLEAANFGQARKPLLLCSAAQHTLVELEESRSFPHEESIVVVQRNEESIVVVERNEENIAVAVVEEKSEENTAVTAEVGTSEGSIEMVGATPWPRREMRQ